MKWNERTMDCLKSVRTRTRPSCRTEDNCDWADLDLVVSLPLIRDLLFGPKVIDELAILRHIASSH